MEKDLEIPEEAFYNENFAASDRNEIDKKIRWKAPNQGKKIIKILKAGKQKLPKKLGRFCALMNRAKTESGIIRKTATYN